MPVLRHDETSVIQSDLDPIMDIMNFISAFKSTGFSSDILRNVHGFTSSAEIKKTSKLISLHVNNSERLAQQGFESAPETSFLPLYYSTLNLSKVYLLLLKKRVELEKNRWHGAKYTEGEMNRQFLNEKIKIESNGTIPLLYFAITGNKIDKSGFIITLKEIYQNISTISAEYSMVTKLKEGFLNHLTEFVEDKTNGHYMKVRIGSDNYINDPPNPRALKAFSGLKKIKNPNGEYHYETARFQGDFQKTKKKLTEGITRHLLSDYARYGIGQYTWLSSTPISGRKHVFNEEMHIMLAYFHLSNVIRYNPEHLYRLMDSKYWPIILGLRKHGFLRFEKLMYGNFIKKSFDIK